jgi:DNA polymerase V
LALFSSPVAAGYPSPAEDYVEGKLDLNAHLIRRPAATFIVRVEGESMTGAGIFPNDLLVVDRSVDPRPGDIIIAAVGNELTVKRLIKRGAGWSLRAENPDFPVIPITADMECVVWGVVTGSIRQFNRR